MGVGEPSSTTITLPPIGARNSSAEAMARHTSSARLKVVIATVIMKMRECLDVLAAIDAFRKTFQTSRDESGWRSQAPRRSKHD
jgi:hypothetical protein